MVFYWSYHTSSTRFLKKLSGSIRSENGYKIDRCWTVFISRSRSNQFEPVFKTCMHVIGDTVSLSLISFTNHHTHIFTEAYHTRAFLPDSVWSYINHLEFEEGVTYVNFIDIYSLFCFPFLFRVVENHSFQFFLSIAHIIKHSNNFLSSYIVIISNIKTHLNTITYSLFITNNHFATPLW